MQVGHSLSSSSGLRKLSIIKHNGVTTQKIFARAVRRHVVLAAAEPTESGSARSVLDAFFYGRAFAEILNERLGLAVDDLLSDFGKWDAERRQAFREFQEEVESRAHAEMLQSKQAPSGTLPRSGASGTREPVIAPPPDLDVTVDDLRAEIASARAAAQRLRNMQKASPNPQPM